MAGHVLSYDKRIVPQETGYWCGPASAQVVLNSRGILVAERALATEIGTTWNGTDFVGLIENVLDIRVPDAEYTSVNLPTAPSAAQCRRFWQHVRASIDARWGVIANIVAPPSNYPRSVPPSTIHLAYGGGVIFHYLSIMGYAWDGPAPDVAAMSDAEFMAWAKRAKVRLWLADSGFSPYGAWVDFSQMCSLIPPKAYCYAAARPAAGVPRTGADEVLTRRYASRSKYRGTDEPVGTLADFVLWIDGRVHEEYSERERVDA